MWRNPWADPSLLLSPVLLHTATANGFQMVTSGVQSKAVSDWLITSVEVSACAIAVPRPWDGAALRPLSRPQSLPWCPVPSRPPVSAWS